MAIAERRYYTTFVIEAGVSFTTVAGSLEQIGPFKVCDIVRPNIRVFRKWVEVRQAELAEQARIYFEETRKRQEEIAVHMERQAQERALLREAELAAEKIAAVTWGESEPPPARLDYDPGELDDYPF